MSLGIVASGIMKLVLLVAAGLTAVYGQAGNEGQKDERLYELGLDLLRYQLHNNREDEAIGKNASDANSGETFTQQGNPGRRDQSGTLQLSVGTSQRLRPTPFAYPQQSNRRPVMPSPPNNPGQTDSGRFCNTPTSFEQSGPRTKSYEADRYRQSSQVPTTNYNGQNDREEYIKRPSNYEQPGFSRRFSVSDYERRGQGRYTNGPEEVDYREKTGKLDGKGYSRSPYELLRSILEDDRYFPERRSKYNSNQNEYNPRNYDDYNTQRSRTGDQYGTYSEGTRDANPGEREREEYQRLRRKLENYGNRDQEYQRRNPERVVYQSNPQHVVLPVVNTQGNIRNYPTHSKDRQTVPKRTYQSDVLSIFLPPQLLSLISTIPEPPRSSDGHRISDQNLSKEEAQLYKIPNGLSSVMRKRKPGGRSLTDSTQFQSRQGVNASSSDLPKTRSISGQKHGNEICVYYGV